MGRPSPGARCGPRRGGRDRRGNDAPEPRACGRRLVLTSLGLGLRSAGTRAGALATALHPSTVGGCQRCSRQGAGLTDNRCGPGLVLVKERSQLFRKHGERTMLGTELWGGVGMRAVVGDGLTLPARVVGASDQISEIIEIRGTDGAPRYLVRGADKACVYVQPVSH